MSSPRIFAVLLCTVLLLAACKRSDSTPEENLSSDEPLPADLPDLYRSFWHGNAASEEEDAANSNNLPCEWIALERRSTMTAAPNYRVVFHRSGLAELDDRGGPTPQRFTGTLDSGSYARLCYLIERSGF